jgi:MFS family permease
VLFGRFAGTMMGVTLILFVLARYHSPQLAGLTAFFSGVPGILVSPIAGALLDRRGRARLMVLDYVLAASAAGLIACLAALNALPVVVLIGIVGIASLTNPLSSAGGRSLFPVITPPALWERANALDSSGYLIATLLAPPLAGVLVAFAGGVWALAAAGVLYLAAATVMLRLHDPATKVQAGGSLLAQAWQGLGYFVRHPTLRGLALTLSTYNVGAGVLMIAVPVLVLGRLHLGPDTVGLLWGAMGAGGLVSSLVVGRMSTNGRERQLIIGSILLGTFATALLPFANALPVVALAVILVGVANGPFDIGMFTLRQRRTDPAWFGRAFAVSMSANYLGYPIGSALAGPLIGASLNLALWAAVAICLASALLPLLMIPARDERALAPSRQG